MFKRACLYVVLGTALALPASCFFYKDDPNFCPGVPHDNCLSIGPMMCDGPEDCSGNTAVCDVAGTKTCVQCTPTDKNACMGQTPACIDNSCQPCTAHDQCDSKACLIDQGGTCADSGEVAYVQSGGSGSACTFDLPCGTLTPAVATGKAYIKMTAGTVKDSATTTIQGRTVTILADPGAILDCNGNGAILQVSGANTNVSIYDLRITGATGTNDSAIHLAPAVATTSLSLTRVTVDQNQGGGILSQGGALTISRSTFSGNQRGGISIVANEATFDITNNFIVQNGDVAAGTFGGVNLNVVTSGSSRFEFNTVADNRVASGATRSGGVICDIVGFTASNNIVARNRLGTDATAPNAQTLGVCIYRTSKIQNDVAGLNFASPDMMPFSYKLSEGSSAINQATTPSLVTIDHDGDPRPQGAQKDIGADELRQ
jgi:hypothetical protein